MDHLKFLGWGHLSGPGPGRARSPTLSMSPRVGTVLRASQGARSPTEESTTPALAPQGLWYVRRTMSLGQLCEPLVATVSKFFATRRRGAQLSRRSPDLLGLCRQPVASAPGDYPDRSLAGPLTTKVAASVAHWRLTKALKT